LNRKVTNNMPLNALCLTCLSPSDIENTTYRVTLYLLHYSVYYIALDVTVPQVRCYVYDPACGERVSGIHTEGIAVSSG